MFYIFPLLLSFWLAIIITPVIKKLALHLKIVDLPAPRKIHSAPVPLLGGLAIFLAFLISVVIFWFNGSITDTRIDNLSVVGLLVASTLLMLGGFLDDKYNLKPWQQTIFPIATVIIALLTGIKIQYVTNPLGGVLAFPALTGTILAAFWLFGMMYTTKLLDGLDGLVSGITTIGAIIIFIVSLAWDVPFSGTSVLALILAGSALGFLIYNWHPATIFMGEGGSVFCGFILGALAIISGSKIATALLIMGIPILDVAWVILRRLLQGKSPAVPDRKHLHFRLLDIGLTHRQSVLFLYLITASFGIASLFLQSAGKVVALGVLALVMLILAVALIIIYKLKIKHDKQIQI